MTYQPDESLIAAVQTAQGRLDKAWEDYRRESQKAFSEYVLRPFVDTWDGPRVQAEHVSIAGWTAAYIELMKAKLALAESV